MPIITFEREATTASHTLLDLAPLRAVPCQREPYPWIAATGCLRPAALPGLARDFPRLSRPGYHPVAQLTPHGVFAGLLAEIEAGTLDAVVGERLVPRFRIGDQNRPLLERLTAA